MTDPILIVDDDPFALKLLARQLAAAGAAVVETALSGEQALAILSEEEVAFQLVLLDLNMPDMDGVEFVRHLAARQYGGTLVLVSGEDRRVVEAAVRLAVAHRLHVLGHLSKPVQPAELRALLGRWSGRTLSRPMLEGKGYSPDEIRGAIERKQLVNYYQPKVDVVQGVFCGVETLVRWRHPVDGLVMPDQFIPVAEACGLIDSLTRAVLTEAVRQARYWADTGLALQVAVNVSMDNLRELGFGEFVLGELIRHGLPSSRLVLEVTESRLMESMLVPLDILTRLRLRRVGLSIDDFGTGHSSLAQIRDLPFEELKIDRGFVHGASTDKTRAAIFGASLAMARQMGMKTVAEGVEDAADWQFLRAQGCDLAQGYFIGRPMPADALDAWLADWETRRSDLTQ